MTRITVAGFLAGVVAVAAPWVSDPAPTPVTFYKDVLPILQAKCQSCHSPGQMAPLSFTTYRETRPWAQAIKTMVLARKMPPWTAEVRNFHRFLTPPEIETLVKWVDNGAPRGDPKDAPPFDEWTVSARL
jgi:hypothetical protein